MPYQASPCKTCPFRKAKDNKFTFPRERAEELADGELHICHTNSDKACAGHILMVKRQSLAYRMIKIFDKEMPTSKCDIFTKEEWINHVTRENK